MKVLLVDGSFERWRDVTRELLVHGVPPCDVAFSDGEGTAFLPGMVAENPAAYGVPEGCDATGARYLPMRERSVAPLVPAPFLALAERVALHRDPARWSRLYAVLWRVVQDGAVALQDHTDGDVAAVQAMAEAVRKDVHRFHALVRFRCLEEGQGRAHYVAWHRPDHRTLRAAAPFFVRRFGGMRWSILTPDESAHWNRVALSFGPGMARDPGTGDEAEESWRAYYASTFNPARVNPKLMRSHLPERVRATLPESREMEALIRGSRGAK